MTERNAGTRPNGLLLSALFSGNPEPLTSEFSGYESRLIHEVHGIVYSVDRRKIAAAIVSTKKTW